MDDETAKKGACLIAVPTPDQLLDEFLSERLSAALGEFTRQAWGPEDGSLDPDYRLVKRLRGLRSAVGTLAEGVAPGALTPLYLVSSSFLREASDFLTETEDERLVYATGPEDGTRLFALTRLVMFELAEVSVVGAAPEPASQLQALAELEENGERILATLHSHPGKGAGATTPSSTDLSTQEGLEKLGYPAIGVVFSRNGFIRFYSRDLPFRVVVSGTGIEPVEEHLFRLDEVKQRSFFCRRSP
jgi:proteasome lid subunit RPN8/RPN11